MSSHGKEPKPPGRPPRFGEPMTMTRLYMTRDQIEYAKQIGGGEFSAGLRKIVNEHRAAHDEPLRRDQ